MPTDGLLAIDRNTVQICAAPPEHNAETPALADEPDDPMDSCDELEQQLVAYHKDTPENLGGRLRDQRRVHEPAGYFLYKHSDVLPVLTAHRPKQTMSTDDVADVLVERFHHKHGAVEPTSFKGAMLR